MSEQLKALAIARDAHETREQVKFLLGDSYGFRVEPFKVVIRAAIAKHPEHSPITIALAVAKAMTNPVQVGLCVAAALDIVEETP